MELAQERFSVRDFSDKPINDEQLQMILDAGRLAPTAANFQPQRIYVLESEEALKRIRSLTKMTFNAPVVVLICHDKSESWKAERLGDDFDAGEMDATIVATFMMMEATELGIGSLWVRGFNGPEIEKALGMPENIVLDLILDLGYPKEGHKPNAMHDQRKDLSETVVVF